MIMLVTVTKRDMLIFQRNSIMGTESGGARSGSFEFTVMIDVASSISFTMPSRNFFLQNAAVDDVLFLTAPIYFLVFSHHVLPQTLTCAIRVDSHLRN